jgi:hypothetical protein
VDTITDQSNGVDERIKQISTHEAWHVATIVVEAVRLKRFYLGDRFIPGK